MHYHTLFFRKLGKMLQKLPSAAVVIAALRVKFGIGCSFVWVDNLCLAQQILSHVGMFSRVEPVLE